MNDDGFQDNEDYETDLNCPLGFVVFVSDDESVQEKFDANIEQGVGNQQQTI